MDQPSDAPGLRTRDARAAYFARNGFGDGGYTDRWVKLAAGPITLAFPNSAARVEAVRRHDLHHIATGFDTTWTGEAEIGAWEIASGCGRFAAAWVLNLQALAIGMWLAPSVVLRAFAWGRRCDNLYHHPFDEESLLEETVGELRSRLGLEEPCPTPEAGDRLRLAGWALVSALWSLATLGLLAAPWLGLAWLLTGA